MKPHYMLYNSSSSSSSSAAEVLVVEESNTRPNNSLISDYFLTRRPAGAVLDDDRDDCKQAVRSSSSSACNNGKAHHGQHQHRLVNIISARQDLEHAVAGALAGIFVSLCLHPLDTVKTVIQSSSSSCHAPQNKSVCYIAKTIISRHHRGTQKLFYSFSLE